MTQTANRLHKHMADMVALEDAIEQVLARCIPEVADHATVSTLLREFHTMVKGQLYALDARLQTLAHNIPIPESAVTVFSAGGYNDGHEHRVSAILQMVYTIFNQAVIGYATLQPLAHRFRESWVVAADGTAAHLARQHTQNYVHAIQQIGRLLHDVVVWELDNAGLECQCTCPSCGLGVCLCAVSARTILSDAWATAVPIAVDDGIYVHPPRQGSPAAKAGLRHGDSIVAADGQETRLYGVLQTVVRDHNTGEKIQLTIRRGLGEIAEVTAIRH